MIITVCLLILAFSILKRPLGGLLKKCEDFDWKSLTQDAWEKIVTFSKRVGRVTTGQVLKFYYVLAEGDLSTFEKALVYAGIIYIVVPSDMLPRRVLGWLGMLDDAGVAVWLYNKVGSKITPEIEQKVARTLDEWFGPEIIAGAN